MMPVTAVPIAPGDAGTVQTIDAMRRLIDDGKKDPAIYEFVAQLVRCLPPPFTAQAKMAQARRVFDGVLAAVRFTPDIRGKETLKAARETLRLGIGDCDDFTILVCAALEAIGMHCRIVTVAAEGPDPDAPGEPAPFTHVFPEVCIGGRWVAVDAARRHPRFGAWPRRFTRWRVWDTQSPDYQDVAGLNGMDGGSLGPGSPLAVMARQRSQLQGLGRGISRGGGGGMRRIRPRARMRGLGFTSTVPSMLPNAMSPHPAFTGLGARRLGVYGLRGQGHYGAVAIDQVRRSTPGLAGLGQDDLQTVLQTLPAITTGTTNIITAVRANPLNLTPYTGSPAPVTGLTPAATAAIYGAQYQYGAGNPLASLSAMPSWIWILGLGIVAVAIARNR